MVDSHIGYDIGTSHTAMRPITSKSDVMLHLTLCQQLRPHISKSSPWELNSGL